MLASSKLVLEALARTSVRASSDAGGISDSDGDTSTKGYLSEGEQYRLTRFPPKYSTKIIIFVISKNRMVEEEVLF